MNVIDEIGIKKAYRLIIGHLNIKFLQNKFEMLEELIKDKIDIFLVSETKFVFCTESLNLHPKNCTLFMAVNKGFKKCITNRPEQDDLQNTNL